MPAPLNSFLACQIVTLKNAGLSYQKIADELGILRNLISDEKWSFKNETVVSLCRKGKRGAVGLFQHPLCCKLSKK